MPLLLTILSVTALRAQSDRVIRFFLSDGDEIEFRQDEVDSITTVNDAQLVWRYGWFESIPTETIDSVWYMTPSLRLSASELNFGKVMVGNSKTMNVCITNTGEYAETYRPFAAGVFSLRNSGSEVCLQPGESYSLTISFTPYDTNRYMGKVLLSSNALRADDTTFYVEGYGVATEDEEEDVVLPPAQMAVEVDIQDEEDSFLSDLKIVSTYGEFPVEKGSLPRHARGKAFGGEPEAVFKANALMPQDVFTPIFLTKEGKPFLFAIPMPKDRPTINVEETALALLLTEPLLATDDETVMRNTKEAIKKLNSFDDYLRQVKEAYRKAVKLSEEQQMCISPDYSEINAAPIINELISKVMDNSELTKGGLTIKDKSTKGDAISFKVNNTFKRVIHIYTSQVKTDDEKNLIIQDKKPCTQTLDELLIAVANLSDWGEKEYEWATEGQKSEFCNEIKGLADSLRIALKKIGWSDIDSGIQLPEVLESVDFDLWKVAKGTIKGERNSPYEIATDELTVKLDPGYNKAMVEIYGMGAYPEPGDSWDNYTTQDKLRLTFAFIHGMYKDMLQPMLNLFTNGSKAVNATGSDNYKYDLRFGKRKDPEWALMTKLSEDFAKYGDINKVFRCIHIDPHAPLESIAESIGGVLLELSKFAYNRILTLASDDPNDDRRTYFNLIYNIGKKYSGVQKTSKKFRDQFKSVANNLTYLKKTDYASKVVDATEAGVDLVAGCVAYNNSNLKNTYILDKSTEARVSILQPTKLVHSLGEVELKWEYLRGSNVFGKYCYILDFFVDTPDGMVKSSMEMPDTNPEYTLNLAGMQGADKAINIYVRVKACHPENKETVYQRSEVMHIYNRLPKQKMQWADLGLKSGTLWARCNLGADNATDVGNYYQWGDVIGSGDGKTSFSWNTYKYSQGAPNSLTKYCTKAGYSNYDNIDRKFRLEGSDDAASAIYGYTIGIPTEAEWQELMDECRWDRYEDGVIVYGGEESILLPPTGYMEGSLLKDPNEGHYWSSDVSPGSPDDAGYLHFQLIQRRVDNNIYNYYRSQGRCIRPVMRPILLQQAFQ